MTIFSFQISDSFILLDSVVSYFCFVNTMLFLHTTTRWWPSKKLKHCFVFPAEQFNNFIVKAGLDNNYKIIFTDPGSTNVNDYQPRSKNLIWPMDGAMVRVERNGLQTIVVICELEIFAGILKFYFHKIAQLLII